MKLTKEEQRAVNNRVLDLTKVVTKKPTTSREEQVKQKQVDIKKEVEKSKDTWNKVTSNKNWELKSGMTKLTDREIKNIPTKLLKAMSQSTGIPVNELTIYTSNINSGYKRGKYDYFIDPDERRGVTPKEPITSLENEVVRMYKEGYSTRVIGKNLEISMGKIYTYLNRNSVPKRTLGGTSKIAIKMAPILKDQELVRDIIWDYNNGVPLKAIYSNYNIHKNGLYYILDKLNVKRRGGRK